MRQPVEDVVGGAQLDVIELPDGCPYHHFGTDTRAGQHAVPDGRHRS
jgi:hypothetical protein